MRAISFQGGDRKGVWVFCLSFPNANEGSAMMTMELLKTLNDLLDNTILFVAGILVGCFLMNRQSKDKMFLGLALLFAFISKKLDSIIFSTLFIILSLYFLICWAKIQWRAQFKWFK